MASYPIWIDVLSCIYKSPKSYGIKREGNQTIYVGTSRRNSHPFAHIRLTHHKQENGDRTYHLYLDGTLVKQARLVGTECTIDGGEL